MRFLLIYFILFYFYLYSFYFILFYFIFFIFLFFIFLFFFVVFVSSFVFVFFFLFFFCKTVELHELQWLEYDGTRKCVTHMGSLCHRGFIVAPGE